MHVCMGVRARHCNCSHLTLCMPAGERRGHMLVRKMSVYHHSELSEGERRGRGVAGGSVTARKEKMKNSEKRSGMMERRRKQKRGWLRR